MSKQILGEYKVKSIWFSLSPLLTYAQPACLLRENPCPAFKATLTVRSPIVTLVYVSYKLVGRVLLILQDGRAIVVSFYRLTNLSKLTRNRV